MFMFRFYDNKFKLNWKQIIFPAFILGGKDKEMMNIYERKRKIITNTLSVDNILKSLKRIDDLFDILFDENQRLVFEHLPMPNFEFMEKKIQYYSYKNFRIQNALRVLKTEENEYNRKLLLMYNRFDLYIRTNTTSYQSLIPSS
jgi:hypothetical protein